MIIRMGSTLATLADSVADTVRCCYRSLALMMCFRSPQLSQLRLAAVEFVSITTPDPLNRVRLGPESTDMLIGFPESDSQAQGYIAAFRTDFTSSGGWMVGPPRVPTPPSTSIRFCAERSPADTRDGLTAYRLRAHAGNAHTAREVAICKLHPRTAEASRVDRAVPASQQGRQLK